MDSMNSYEKKVISTSIESLVVFIIGITWPIFSFHGVFILPEDKPEMWFARSGAVCVLAAIWVEFNLVKLTSILNPPGYISLTNAEIIPKHKNKLMAAQFLAAILSICGTAIWGYGDLFYDIHNKSQQSQPAAAGTVKR